MEREIGTDRMNASEMADKIRELSAIVTLMKAERDILATMYSYGHHLDYGGEEEFLDCFTPTGCWWSQPRGMQEPRARWQDREGLRAFFRQHTHAPVKYHKHLLIEPRILVDGDEANVASYWARLDGADDDGGPMVSSFGRYDDVLRRCPDGKWRIHDRHVEAEHWVTTAV